MWAGSERAGGGLGEGWVLWAGVRRLGEGWGRAG